MAKSKGPTIAQLKQIAKQLGIADYNTIQRGALALNRATGSKYSARDILRQEIFARQHGSTTANYKDVLSVRGVRADVSYSRDISAQEEAGRYFLQQQFSRLAEKQGQVYSLVHGQSGDYIAPNGAVWHPQTGPDGSDVYYNQRTGAMRASVPAGSIPYTTKDAYRAIRQIVDKMPTKRDEQPANAYDDVAIEL